MNTTVLNYIGIEMRKPNKHIGRIHRWMIGFLGFNIWDCDFHLTRVGKLMI